MADIFVSYARHDKALVAPLVAALEREGYSVWWDPAIAPGQEFDRQIVAELDAARAVIVVWTPVSVDSRWVRGEAREAADRGILVPVRFEGAKMPLDVRSLHTTDLDHWGENPTSVAFKEVLRALSALFTLGTRQSTIAATGSGENFVSIAVLPFVNMSADPDQEYFSDGLSEELINQLVKIKSLRVAGRTSSFVFKGKTDDLRSIGNKLGVNHVLEGSVRKAGQRLRIASSVAAMAFICGPTRMTVGWMMCLRSRMRSPLPSPKRSALRLASARRRRYLPPGPILRPMTSTCGR